MIGVKSDRSGGHRKERRADVQAQGYTDNSVKPNSGGGWHPSAHIVYSKDSKGATVVNLLKQNAELQAVIRGSFHVATKHMLFEDAYPVMQSRTAFARDVLLTAARARGSSAAEIKRRLKAVDDGGFAEDLAGLVRTLSRYRALCAVDVVFAKPLARMNLLRGNLKEAAAKMILHAYGLTDLDETELAKCVQDLLENDRYIFPVDPTVSVRDSLNCYH